MAPAPGLAPERVARRGKAGKLAELGVPVCVVEDENGFILDKEIMWTGGDRHIAIPLTARFLEAFRNLGSAISTAASFTSPGTQWPTDVLISRSGLCGGAA